MPLESTRYIGVAEVVGAEPFDQEVHELIFVGDREHATLPGPPPRSEVFYEIAMPYLEDGLRLKMLCESCRSEVAADLGRPPPKDRARAPAMLPERAKRLASSAERGVMLCERLGGELAAQSRQGGGELLLERGAEVVRYGRHVVANDRATPRETAVRSAAVERPCSARGQVRTFGNQ